jgi:hypothetical protein
MTEPPTANWLPISQAPEDGTPFGAYLHKSGIRKLKWQNGEEAAETHGGDPAQYEDAFVEVSDIAKSWSPKWFIPIDAIPEPPND